MAIARSIDRRALLVAGATALACGPAPIRAQPVAGGRPVRVIVPFPPGGAVDITSRLFAEKLGTALGQTVVVENRSGAGGLIGADVIAKADKDGSALGLISATTHCAAPFMHARMPFNVQQDLLPVTQLTDGALLCVVNAEAAQRNGWTDFRALILWSRANPEQVRMGSSGSGTSSHLNISAVNRFADAKILHVPYRGGGPAINDLVAGNIDMMFDVMPALMPHVEAGRFKALAVSSGDPIPLLPNIPGMKSFADLGLGDHSLVNWNVVTTAGGTPPAVVQRLFEASQTVARQRDFVERLRPLGYGVVLSDSPAAAAEMIRGETPRWQRLVEISGARIE
ncbi:tripartite tricarboxylate transporter substrate binding protein [Roseomonas terrae]|jgi:tripartite-type tricarboxylate transporter receptor subunit TctC|uniref:Tripartite tricarboxylate transporter substrate binding protein n=1 Tax=Neoroseomonas terrae TaxID=424799 RepID=A0ABS5EMP3_9PROT|nr:tripartite tricarboxylate transporter substrate binding protein [Neoroseomonas terrae]MBR0652283.1 tripartite tricarboxylate transporter substrate binding protein [Neoroseomonas terrae]